MRNRLFSLLVVSTPLVLGGCVVVGRSTTHTRSMPSFGLPHTSGIAAPAISSASTAKDLNAFVSYYKERGYTITTNQQTFRPDGKVDAFQFNANIHNGTSNGKVSVTIDSATHSVARSEDNSSAG